MNSPYEDIIHLPHPVSAKRASMSIADRAAQFSPFAALTGYETVLAESRRLTCQPTELTGAAVEELNRSLQKLAECLADRPEVTVTYFLPDIRKTGGSYCTVTGKVRRIDCTEGFLEFTDRSQIPLCQIISLIFR